ncbi:hypothetical protein, variant [Aphanomyces invadans]|uniref:Condensin complex subunit 1 C-terminal domain-containing protein n=1 Tax=Aphanomyces invadans TaxID=157072 RepID=A0A024TYQ3_9STRA|nr:hypothetical protein, variant [Aphanomyces invadans]ETV99290.1 hypothetical protein, variant [Aphanomyces invadans]|eukprot:XP_008871846.1 hypothetical protein, variant [Aphanomyces invadans]
MGKVKKRRNISHKNIAPPTGGPSQAEIDDAMEGLDDEVDANDGSTAIDAAVHGKKQVPDFLSGLTNLQGSVREATCVALASFFAGDGTPDKLKMLQKLLHAGLLKKLLPRAVDPSTLVRLHAVGALRNISAFGGLDVSESMTNEDIMTPCIKLVIEYATENLDVKATPHAVPILEQVFALLTNLCESCSLALIQVTHQRHVLLPAMLRSLHLPKQPLLHLETMKLLLVLSDNNPDLIQSLPAELPLTLLQILQAPEHSTKLRLTAIGVAINLPNVLDNAQSVEMLLPVLQSAVAYDPIGVVGQAQAASEQWALSQEDYGTVEVYADDDVDEKEHVDKVKKAVAVVRSWRDNVHILTLGLELLSNMLANVDSGDVDEWASDDEDGMEAAAQAQGTTEVCRPVSVPAQVFGAQNILPHVYSIVQSVVTVPAHLAAPVVDDFAAIRERALNCLTNLTAHLSVADLTRGCDLNQVFRVVLALYADVQVKHEESKAMFQPDQASTGDVDAAVYAIVFESLRDDGGKTGWLR